MSHTPVPDVSPGDFGKASWADTVRLADLDLTGRVEDLEDAVGSGSVTGPVSSTDNAIALFDGTGGSTLKNSSITVSGSGSLSGSNSGDVTLSGSPNYLTLAGQVITRAFINLATHVTGRLLYANLTASTSANRLMGRGSSGGAGDFEEIALGANLSMSGTTLNAAGGSGGALDDLSDVVITTPTTDDVLQYDGASWVNQPIVGTAPAAATYLTLSTNGTLTNERVLTASGRVSITDAGAGSTATLDVPNDAITYAKIQNVSAASRLLGRGSAGGSGDVEELTISTGLTLTGTALSATGSGGDVVGPASSVDAEIALFDSTTGKLLKRASGTGFVRNTSGVYSASKLKRTVGAFVGDGSTVITTGVSGFISCPVAGTITKVRLLSSDAAVTSGSIVIDIWKDTYANYPPTVADTITASAKPTITTATKSEDSTLTGWTTNVSAGDVFGFNVDSVTSLKRVAVELTVEEG